MNNFFDTMQSNVRGLFAMHGEPEKARRLADIFWRAMLLLILLYLIISISYGEWLLYRALRDIEAAPMQALPPAPIDRTSIDAVVSGLQARQQHYDSLKAHPNTAVPDPSN